MNYQLRLSDVQDVPTLLRQLNTFLTDIQQRLDALERTKTALVTVDFTTKGTIAAGFPLKVTTPKGLAPKSVKVAAILNPAAPSVALTTAVWPHWRVGTDGNIELMYLTGLAVSTRYVMLLEVTGNG